MNKGLGTPLIIGAVVLLALIAFPLVGGGYGWRDGGWSMMGNGMMGGFGGGWLMVILVVLIAVLVIWAIVALGRGSAHPGDHSHHEDDESALEVLRKRYARGDINKQEFEEKKRDIEGR